MLGEFYKIHLRNRLFNKIIVIYGVMTVVTIVALSYIIFGMVSRSKINNELEVQNQVIQNVNAYITGRYTDIRQAVQNMYKTEPLADNTSFFLSHTYKEYMEFRLNRYYENASSSVYNSYHFFEQLMEDRPEVNNIVLYGVENEFLYVYDRQRPFQIYKLNSATSYIPEAVLLDNEPVSIPNEWIRNVINRQQLEMYSIREDIRDYRTYKTVATMYAYLDSTAIRGMLPQETGAVKGTILVLDAEGRVMFDSSDTYYGQTYPYMDKLKTNTAAADLNADEYISTVHSEAGYTVASILPKSEFDHLYRELLRMILLLSGLCIVAAALLPSLFVLNFSRRTDTIIGLIRRVREGDLTARVHMPQEDELGQISSNFNYMLDELTEYINRSYKAEIEQKRTELLALQAQVNPHFLYNTLEVIRMRAISQGAEDVGEMIYCLAGLFKNLVKEETIVTIGREIENCRLYLELFRIRYKERFRYEIDIDDELKEVPIVKLSLQPLIENFIVHGLRKNGSDNWLRITAEHQDQEITIRITDNGTGIEPDRLERIRHSMNRSEVTGDSVGIHNVQKRLSFYYGSRYGLSIHSVPEKGTEVLVRIPDKKGDSAHV